MHDSVTAERHGTPATSVMTSSFVSAAETMLDVLGAAGHSFVVIDHPISSATIDQLGERARLAADAIATQLTT